MTVFEGSISDRQIIIDSNFTDNLVPGNLVLGDRGFTMHDLCGEEGAILEIPPFFNGRPALTIEENLKSKLLSKARVRSRMGMATMTEIAVATETEYRGERQDSDWVGLTLICPVPPSAWRCSTCLRIGW